MTWLKIFGPIFAAVLLFSAGYRIGGTNERHEVEAEYKQKLLDAAEVATQILDKRQGELNQCRAEVTKYNQATAEQAKKNAALIVADQARRSAAQRAQSERDKAQAERLEIAFQTLDQLRGLIDDGAFEGCAVEPVPDDLVRMLNSALTGAGGDVPGSDGDLPGE